MTILGEICEFESQGCPPLFQSETANDWTHSNSIGYSPNGDLLLSVRHLDAVFKIDFDNGSGTGEVVLRLGKGGDIQIISNDPWPWFSHQHDVKFQGSLIVAYDNGNTLVAGFGGNS